MEMSGERSISATRTEVWAALNDPDVLKACISGCQSMEKTSDTSFTAKVVQKVGPVKATFTGEVELSDIVEGESYTISGKGKGGAAGCTYMMGKALAMLEAQGHSGDLDKIVIIGDRFDTDVRAGTQAGVWCAGV